jgi:hypothetical protein
MIRKSLQKLFCWVNNYNSLPEYSIPTSIRKDISISKEGMNFTIHPATGGYILEYRVYDKKNDRNDNKLHIINNDQDLGESIGKIITLEILRT